MSNNKLFQKTDNYFIVSFSIQILLAFISFVLVENEIFATYPKLSEGFNISVITAATSTVLLGIFLNRKIDPNRLKLESVDTKVRKYLKAVMLKMSIAVSTNLLIFVGFILTAEYVFAFIAGLIAVLFLTYRPSKEKFLKDYNISQKEFDQENGG